MIKKEIVDPKLIAHLNSIEKDGMSVFTMADGRFRGAFFNGTRFVNQMRLQQNTGLLETMVLGQACLCAALLIPMMKGREHTTFRYDTDGPAAGFSVEADSSGYVRGFMLQNHIPVDKPLESWDLAPFFGDGTVTMTHSIEGEKEPHVGATEIVYKNIAHDLTYYFAQSEQIHTAFNTGIQYDKEGRVIGAGGLYLQVMPNYGGREGRELKEGEEDFWNMDDDELLTRAENAFRAMPSIGEWFAQKGNRDDIVYGLFREFRPKVLIERDVIYDCPCCQENFVKAIKNLGKDEVADIIANDPSPLEVSCHNCGSVYQIPKELLKD